MVTNLESMDTTLARAAVQVATRDRAEKDAEAICTEKKQRRDVDGTVQTKTCALVFGTGNQDASLAKISSTRCSMELSAHLPSWEALRSRSIKVFITNQGATSCKRLCMQACFSRNAYHGSLKIYGGLKPERMIENK